MVELYQIEEKKRNKEADPVESDIVQKDDPSEEKGAGTLEHAPGYPDKTTDSDGNGQDRLFKTCASYIAMFGLGLVLCVAGTTLVNLEDFMETDIKTLGLAFMFRGAGMILGSLLIPILLNKINNELFFALCSLLLGVACLSPCTGSVYGFMVGMGVMGLATGFIAAGQTAYIVKLWGKTNKRTPPLTQAMYMSFSVGCAIAPLIAAPFLISIDDEEDSDSVTDIPASTQDPLVKNETSGSEMVIYAYVTIGITNLVPCFLFLWLYILFVRGGSGGRVKVSDLSGSTFDKTPELGQRKKENTTFFWTLMLLAFLLEMFAIGGDVVPLNYLSPFVVKKFDWSVFNGALITTVFLAIYCLGRFAGIFVSMVLTPGKMITVNLVLVMSAHSLMSFLPRLSEEAIWAVVVLGALGASTNISTVFLWTASHIPSSKIHIASMVVTCGYSAGDMMITPIAAYMFQTYSRMWIAYLVLITISCAAVVYVLLQLLVKCGKSPPEVLTTCVEANEHL